jgi:hypothetical protein
MSTLLLAGATRGCDFCLAGIKPLEWLRAILPSLSASFVMALGLVELRINVFPSLSGDVLRILVGVGTGATIYILVLWFGWPSFLRKEPS